MADDTVSVEVKMPNLSGFKGELAKRVDDAFGKLGADIVNAVQAKVMSGPTGGRGRAKTAPHNSRRQAAAGVQADHGSMRLVLKSDGSRMATGRAAFPAAYNLSRWSHPVFGNRNARVSQRGAGDYFVGTIKTFQDRVTRELDTALQAASDSIK